MNKYISLEQFRSKKTAIAILILLHIVGAIGFLSPLSDWFVFLTPVNLIITAGMIWIDTKPDGRGAFPIILAIWLMGYGVEILGVKSGFPFGDYSYGEVLGWKFFEVPPLIGINWLIVVWGGFSLSQTIGIGPKLRWLATPILVVILDYVIEPVAIHFELWTWENGVPPIQNFLGWFVVAMLMTLLFERYPLVKKPRLGLVAFIMQLLFFGVIYLRIS